MLERWLHSGTESGSAISLASNATLRLPRRFGAKVVRVERGVVLVTRQGDLEDHVLTPGMEVALRHRTVAWALTPSTIRIGDADLHGSAEARPPARGS
jgi:Protein of unknown function (DUF2917)